MGKRLFKGKIDCRNGGKRDSQVVENSTSCQTKIKKRRNAREGKEIYATGKRGPNSN